MEIPGGLEMRYKNRSPFSNWVYKLGEEISVLSVTSPDTEANQVVAGSSCAHIKRRKMQKYGEINHKLEIIPHNPRPEKGVISCGTGNCQKSVSSKGTQSKHMHSQ